MELVKWYIWRKTKGNKKEPGEGKADILNALVMVAPTEKVRLNKAYRRISAISRQNSNQRAPEMVLTCHVQKLAMRLMCKSVMGTRESDRR